LPPRQRAESLVRQPDATDRPGNGDGFVHVLGVLLGEHSRKSRSRCDFTVNDGHRFALAGRGMNEHEAATAQVAGGGISDG
jgi:hypothetical protein